MIGRATKTTDGLLGATEGQRGDIAARIARASAAKSLGLDVFGVVAAIEGAGSSSPERQCSRCKAKLPATPAYFHRCRRSGGPLGLNYNCKTCANARLARRRERRRKAHPPAIRRVRWLEGDAKEARRRLVLQRKWARSMLRRAEDPGRRADLEGRIADLDRAIGRIEEGAIT